MFIFATCIASDRGRYDRWTLPSIEKIKHGDDIILLLPGDGGLAANYNKAIERVRAEPACDAVVFLHDDVELLDHNFRAKIRNRLLDTSIGIVGAIGASGLTSLEW